MLNVETGEHVVSSFSTKTSASGLSTTTTKSLAGWLSRVDLARSGFMVSFPSRV